MNRRGFTYLSLEEKIDPDDLEAALPVLYAADLLGDHATVTDWLQEKIADPSVAHGLLDHELFRLRDSKGRDRSKQNNALSRHIENVLGSEVDKETIRSAVRAVNRLRDLLEYAAEAPSRGHKPRREYFQNVLADLRNTQEGQLTCKALDLQPAQIANLLGHISNWNLPTLRSYFHDPSKKVLQTLDEQRFQRAWLYFFPR
jgi:hypothetical protein